MRSTVAEVNVSNLYYNLKSIRKYSGNSAIMAIVKANAYGHGLIPISKFLRNDGVEFLGVAFPEEGIALRQSGDDMPIVVLGAASPEEASLFVKYDLQSAVSSFDFVEAVSREAKNAGTIANLHLFIETGMNREGIHPNEAVPFLNKSAKLPNIEFVGVCTHFATSCTNINYANQQLELFNSALDEITAKGYCLKYIHASNSGGLVNLPQARFNLVRPGIMLYGYEPDSNLYGKLDLRPIMTLKSRIALSRKLLTGESVGYGRSFISEKDTVIATIPIGYGDGYLYTLSHKAQCLIRGKRYNLVGTVCMDAVMVDLEGDEIPAGEQVILIGTDGYESIDCYELADLAGTIPYEITTALSARVPRVYVSE